MSELEAAYGLFPIYGEFKDWEDIQDKFGGPSDRSDASPVPSVPQHLLFAIYDIDGYEGSAIVIFYAREKYWFVEGDHCSCRGLEGQWQPEPYETAELMKACLERSYKSLIEKYKTEIFQAIDINEQRIQDGRPNN